LVHEVEHFGVIVERNSSDVNEIIQESEEGMAWFGAVQARSRSDRA
jgi:hypothetical protein